MTDDNRRSEARDRITDNASWDLTRRGTLRVGAAALGASTLGLGASRVAIASHVEQLEPPATEADIPADEPVDRSQMTEQTLSISDGEDLSTYVSNSNSGDLLVVPGGTYSWSSEVVQSKDNWGIRGAWGEQVTIEVADGYGIDDGNLLLNLHNCDNVLVENLYFDTETDGARACPAFRSIVDTAALHHHLIWLCGGTTTNNQGGESRFYVGAEQSSGHVMVDGVVCLNRGTISYSNHGDRILWCSRDGALTIRNVKASGFGDNIIYTRMGGEMTVENCVFANTTPSCVRLGGDNETIRNCTFWVDTDRGVELYELDGNVNTAPVMADNRQNASNGGHIEDCTFIVNSTPNASAVYRYLENQWVEVRNNQVMMNDPNVPGTNLSDDEEITWTNVGFNTTNSSGATVAPNGSATYHTTDVHVDNGLDSGAITPDSRDASFDSGIHHPFPADGDITLPGAYGSEPESTATTDFGDESAGNSPSNWTARWGSSTSDFTVQADTEATGEQLLEFDAAADDRHALSWDAVPDDASDVEVLGKLRAPTIVNSGNHARLYLRGSGSEGNEQAYYFDLREEGFSLYKYPFEELGTVGSPTSGTWYWVRVRAEGTNISLRYWEDGTEEPQSWDLEVLDSTRNAGWVGVGAFDHEASQWDVVSVGTGGATAPMPEEDADGLLEPAGDETGVVAGHYDTDDRAGIEFGVSNDADQQLTITHVTVAPHDASINELHDEDDGVGRWVSEVHIEADVQNGVCDVPGNADLPNTFDMANDGFDDGADDVAILSAGSTGAFALSRFEADGSPVDMPGELVDIDIDYELDDGTTGTSSFTLDVGTGIVYEEDAVAVHADHYDTLDEAGVEFTVSNTAGKEATVTHVTVAPTDSSIDELHDEDDGVGRWVSEIHVDADVQDGVCDVPGSADLPNTFDMANDGWDDAADAVAILSPGSTASTALSRFESAGTPIDMTGEAVDIDLDIEFDGGTTGSSSFTLDVE